MVDYYSCYGGEVLSEILDGIDGISRVIDTVFVVKCMTFLVVGGRDDSTVCLLLHFEIVSYQMRSKQLNMLQHCNSIVKLLTLHPSIRQSRVCTHVFLVDGGERDRDKRARPRKMYRDMYMDIELCGACYPCITSLTAFQMGIAQICR